MARAPERAAMPIVGEPMVEWAVWYAVVMGWRIIPCRGKRALIKNWRQTASNDEAQIRAWWAEFHDAGFVANIAVLMGHGLVTLDVDAKYDGPATLADLEAKHAPLPVTTTSMTGSGGESRHRIWSGGEHVRNKANIGQGIDVQGEGSYIIVPPSVHPETGKQYAWEVTTAAEYGPDAIEPQPIPAWLLEKLAQPEMRHNGSAPSEHQACVDSHRNVYLASQAGKLRAAGFDGAEIYAALTVRNTATCDPPLPEKEVREISYGMERYQPEPELIVTTQAVPVGWQARPANEDKKKRPKKPAPKQPLSDFDWYKEYIGPFVSRSGTIIANNTTLMAVLEKHPDFAATGDLPGATRQFWWDDFTSKVMRDDVEMTDTSITELGAELGSRYNLPVQSDALLNRCLIAVCQKYKRDPLQHYLQNLPGWDMTKRLDTWLLRCAGLTDPALESYHQFCSRNLIVSMIARAFDPGCICRSVLILEGPEEYRKSTFVAQLAPTPEWFDEISGSLDTKEAHMMVQGLWVAELSELDSLGRTEETRLKSFISLRVDAYIPKFKSMRVQPKRRTVFVGTTNDSVYFKGTGNTRFLPVKIITPMDVEYFLTIREQLYAEAMVYYGDNPDQWWRMGEDATTQAETQREQRRQASMIEDDFADWLYRRRFVKHIADAAEFVPEKYRVSMPEIMTGYYGLLAREKWKDPAYERQAKTTLKALEWYPGNKTTFTGPTIGRVKGRPWECNPLAWPAEDGLESL